MIRNNRIRFLPLAAFAVMACALPCRAQWTGTDIGGAPGGSSTWSASTGTLTIVGAGTGASTSTDQFRFTSVPVSGNFKLVARVVSFTGSANAQVGLAVRNNLTANCSAGGIFFMPGIGTGVLPNKFAVQSRNAEPDPVYPGGYPAYNGANTPITVPFWLQLVRVGDNVAVYRSTDGTNWSAASSLSGSPFAISGTVQAGIVVASGGAGTVTAVIDNIYLKKTATSMMPWRTSWTANTLTTDLTGYVAGHVNALWVAPDGTCYTNSAWDEAGEAAKVYKDGKVLGRMISAVVSNSFEGSITSNGSDIYLLGNNYGHGLFRAEYFNDGHRIQTGTPLYIGSACRASGLAYNANNARLYVSRVADDPATQQTGKVLIVDPAKNLYFTPGAGTWINTTPNLIDVTGVTNPAPEAIYQSQYESVGTPEFNIPGLTANSPYTVRLHFAEYYATAAGQRKMNLTVSGAPPTTNYDIFASAGGTFQADIKEFNATSSSTGTLTVTVASAGGNPVINGIEIKAGSNVIKRLNCGGLEAAAGGGNWENNSHEENSFAFTRPGPLCVDKRGNLWIIQAGTTYPASNNFSFTAGWAAIKCYDPNGNYLGKQITDVVNPTAIYYDDRNGADRLLVAENGPNQNIRIYTGLTGTPACTSTFGQVSGIFGGATPGLFFNAAAGNDARFFGPTGLGMDSSGNLYVASGGAGTDLKKFAVSGASWSTTAAWKLQALASVDCGDFDPTVDASDIWSPRVHFTMDYSSATPGGEWTAKSYLWNPISASGTSIPHPWAATSAVYRKINGTPFMFTANQGFAGQIRIYRFVGEQMKYCGRVEPIAYNIRVWLDTDADGIEDGGETFTQPKFTNFDFTTFDVDASGNIYLGMGGVPGSVTARYVHKLIFSSVNGFGVPLYTQGGYIHQDCPLPFKETSMGHLRYLGGPSDAMILMAPETPNAADNTRGGIVARYNNWHTTKDLVFSTTLPKPTTNYNFLYYPTAYGVDGFQYKAVDAVGNYIFAAEMWGPVHVINATTGAYTTKLISGPEMGGLLAWQDMCMGVRAHYNTSTKEYYVLTENSGHRARHNLFRWKPVEKTQTAYYALNQTSGTPVPDTSGNSANGTLMGTTSGTTWKGGRFSNALNFNGTNNRVSLPNNLIKNSTTLTFACWFRTSSSAGCPILGYASSAPPAQPAYYVPAVYVGTDGKLRGEFYNSTGAPITTPGIVNDGMWHHLALVGNVNTQSLYLDGQLVGTISGAINHLTMQYNFLGYSFTPGWPALSNWDSYFQGDLDDVRFYGQALSAEDVANLAAH